MKLVDKLFLSLGCGLLCITAAAAASADAWGVVGLWLVIGIVSGGTALVMFVTTVVERWP